MPARALASGTISFGLVSIPVKLFTAASSEQVRFNMLSADTGARLKQQYLDANSGAVVSRSKMVKGYEYKKGQYVIFSEAELKQLEAARTGSLDIVEFVPADDLDLTAVEKSYYLGADKGGDKAYRLLSHAMNATGKVAIGRWAARGKEQLIAIRPYHDGLILHQLYYASEMRSFEEIDPAAKIEFSALECELAEKLIRELTRPKFEAERFHDDYADRVRQVVDEKVQGKEITLAPEQPRAQIIDLFEALKKSLSQAQAASDSGEDASEDAPLRAKPVKKGVPRKATRKKSAAG